MPPIPRPLDGAKFTLDISGVGGFFGGDETISAMATVHLFKGRRWLGWYNLPGSYSVAKRFGQIAGSRFWDGLFPGANEAPSVTFGLDGRLGPKYFAFLSGTTMQSGHLGYLVMQKAKEESEERKEEEDEKKKEEGGEGKGEEDSEKNKQRKTSACYVALLELKDVKCDGEVPQRPIDCVLLAFIPISASFAACIACAVFRDWYCFSMILLGIIANGITCLVIGSGKLILETNRNPAKGAPPGNGMMIEDNTIIVIKGAEEDVNIITKGKFHLKIRGPPTYHSIGLCSLLLLVQFLFQLLLIPQGTLIGQIMFLGTYAASWIYNSHLSSLEKEKIQAEALFNMLSCKMTQKRHLGTRTMMAVFAYLLICDGKETRGDDFDREEILRNIIPNNTPVWKRWRYRVVQWMETNSTLSEAEALRLLDVSGDDRSILKGNVDDIELLDNLLKDAKSAFAEYKSQGSEDQSKEAQRSEDQSEEARGSEEQSEEVQGSLAETCPLVPPGPEDARRHESDINRHAHRMRGNSGY